MIAATTASSAPTIAASECMAPMMGPRIAAERASAVCQPAIFLALLYAWLDAHSSSMNAGSFCWMGMLFGTVGYSTVCWEVVAEDHPPLGVRLFVLVRRRQCLSF